MHEPQEVPEPHEPHEPEAHLRMAYFLMRYPALSQTFIRREIEALCHMGCDVTVYAIWDFRKTEAGRDEALPGYKPGVVRFAWWQLPWCFFLAVIEALRAVAHWPKAIGLLLTHLPRHSEGWFMIFWGTFAGLALAGRIRKSKPEWLHGAWATAPATAAWVLSAVGAARGFSFGAHAYDVFRHGGDPLLPKKLAAAKLVHTTTMQTADHLRKIYPKLPLVLSRRGLESLPELRHSEPECRPFRLLTVARLVPKKGIVFQLQTLSRLRHEGLDIELHVAGDGPLWEELHELSRNLKLQDCVIFHGAMLPEQVQALYQESHVFWHTGVVDGEGDRDGLPNVIPEAMAHGLPVISSLEPGACEAVHHDVNGLLVDPRETTVLAETVKTLLNDGELRARLGAEGRRWVETHFLIANNAAILAEGYRKHARAEF